MEASKPKWVNPNDISYGVNSLRPGGLHIEIYIMCFLMIQKSIDFSYKLISKFNKFSRPQILDF